MGTAKKTRDTRGGMGGVSNTPKSAKHRYYLGATLHTAAKRADARRARRHGKSNGPTLASGKMGGKGR